MSRHVRDSKGDVSAATWGLPDPVLPAARVRDSIYDEVLLTEAALRTINTAPFLRLQGVKQLGFVYLVWPGATHTRYEHCLGTYHLAARALSGLLARGPEGGLEGVPPELVRATLAAALLHDVGHYPFSHAIEELGHPVESHEKVGRRVIEGSEVATVLERDWCISPGLVADLVDPPRHGAPPLPMPLRQLLSGALDVDKLDYLPRDAHACNVPYGRLDVSRLLESLRVMPGPDGQRRLMVTHKGVGPLHSLISARQEMFDNVYWHHTNRACMAMLLRAVQDALDAGAVKPSDLPARDDSGLLDLLAAPGMPASTRQLVGRLRARKLHRRLVEVSPLAGSLFRALDSLFFDPGRRKRVELALCRAASEALGRPLEGWEVLVDIPKQEKWETDAWVWYQQPPMGMRQVMSWVEATGMQSSDLSRYEEHQRRVRLVVAEELRDLLGGGVLERALLPALESVRGPGVA